MKLFLLYTIALLNFVYCSREPLKIQNAELCEYFNSAGECKESMSSKTNYEVKFPRTKKLENWNQLANHLYFQTKQTPGFIIRFNRNFSLEEKQILRNSYVAYYEFSESTGKVEGVEFGENWIGSFQYLGSIIKDRQREKKEDKLYPTINSLFPATLTFRYKSDLFQGELSSEINLNLLYE
jgi:hypothetical protein